MHDGKSLQKCRIRTMYVPTHGSKGIYRSAGPLAADTSKAIEKVRETIQKDPEEREKLNTKAVGISGAKASLQAKLKKLEDEESKLAKTTRPSEAPSDQKTPQQLQIVTEDSKKANKRNPDKTSEGFEGE